LKGKNNRMADQSMEDCLRLATNNIGIDVETIVQNMLYFIK